MGQLSQNGSADEGNQCSLQLIGQPIAEGSLLKIGAMWSQHPMPSSVFAKESHWRLEAKIVSDSSSAYGNRAQGFALWITHAQNQVPISRWGVATSNFTGLAISAVEFGNFLDTESQIVDVYAVVGRKVTVMPNEAIQDSASRHYCSVPSWDIHRRDSRVIITKRAFLLLVEFSACDNFELDLTSLFEGLSSTEKMNDFLVGISFWTERPKKKNILLLSHFSLERLKPSFLQWDVHDEGDEFAVSADENSFEGQNSLPSMFVYPHRELELEQLHLLSPSHVKINETQWKLLGNAVSVTLPDERFLVRLTGVDKAGSGIIWNTFPIDGHLFGNDSGWKMEVALRPSIFSRNIANPNGMLVFIGDKRPVMDAGKVFVWNNFKGLAIQVEISNASARISYAVGLESSPILLQWGDGALPTSWSSGCEITLANFDDDDTTNLYRVLVMAENASAIVKFHKCVFKLDLKHLEELQFHLAVGAWTSDAIGYLDIRSVSLAEVLPGFFYNLIFLVVFF